MSDRWWQRRKRRYKWLNRVDKADGAKRNLDEMLSRVLGSSKESVTACERCSCQIDGLPALHLKDLRASETSEPLVDVFEDQESVIVVTELIGIDKSSVDLHATEDKLTISVDLPDRRHCRQIQLPARVDVGSSSSRLKNGVLEIRLKKLSEELIIR